MERKRITDQTSNVNTNNIQRSVNIGDINITCPGVTTTTLKHYIFNTEEDSETDSIVLNALEGRKAVEDNLCEQCEQNIVIFPDMKKAPKPSKYKDFRA